MLKDSRPKMPRTPQDNEDNNGLRTWLCGGCGHHAIGPSQPDSCPQCGSGRHDFRRG
ncbi:MAG TPA: hypothetical protein VNZ52_08490 [Candidatus Thermoplasmatota archaeon]|nr:hypothetical protein [Candidatus Thermoplasmatota archaeon]